MNDLTLLNPIAGIGTSGNPRPVVDLPLTGPGLGGGGIGEGSFKRASIAWHMDKSNTLVESAVDVPRFTSDGLLIEGAGENVFINSRSFASGSGDATLDTEAYVGIDGKDNTATKISDTDSNVRRYIQFDDGVDDSNPATWSVFVKKTSVPTTVFPALYLAFANVATVATTVSFDPYNGDILKKDGSADSVSSISYGDWWRFVVSMTNNSSGNVLIQTSIYPAYSTTLGGTAAAGITGSVIVDQVQVELNQAYPSSPIVTEATAVTRATEAGVADTSGAQWDINTTLTSLLSETLGADLVTNGDFAADTDWTKGTGWTIAAGVASCDGSQAGNSNLVQAAVLVEGALHKFTIDVTRSAGILYVNGSSSGSSISATGSYTFYGTRTGTTLYIVADSTFVGTVDNVVVTEVTNDSRGTLVVDWTPGVSADVDTADVGSISVDKDDDISLFYTDAGNNNLKSSDGTTVVTETKDWATNTQLRIVVQWGIDTSTVRQFAVGFINSGSISWSTLDDYDGAYVLDTLLLLAIGGTWPQTFKNIKFFNTVLTDAEIERL